MALWRKMTCDRREMKIKHSMRFRHSVTCIVTFWQTYIYIYVGVCIYIYLCMYFFNTGLYMAVITCILHSWTHVYVYTYTYVRMYVCISSIQGCILLLIHHMQSSRMDSYICIYTYTYLRMYVCMSSIQGCILLFIHPM